jgi:hypothetical protein
MSSLTMVVQWSAHPIWYPKLLPALPKILIFSLEGREVVGSNPTHGVHFCYVACLCYVSFTASFLVAHPNIYYPFQLRSSNIKHVYPYLAYKISTGMGIYRHDLTRTIARMCRVGLFVRVVELDGQICIPRSEGVNNIHHIATRPPYPPKRPFYLRMPARSNPKH